jgi:type IV pilus assembly protein PilO
MKRQLPIWPVIALALVIVAVVAYFVLVGPKRAEAGRLDEKIAKLETDLQAAKLAARPKEAATQLEVADLFELTKAMPDRDDMPGIILELNSVAEAAGIEFRAIAPQNVKPEEGYRGLPISLTFQGNYYDLTDFLFRLRNLVTVRDGKLEAAGRFFTLDALDMHEGLGGFPLIEAKLTISAYVYDPSSHATTALPAPPPTTTTGTTTDATTTSASASAAPGLP